MTRVFSLFKGIAGRPLAWFRKLSLKKKLLTIGALVVLFMIVSSVVSTATAKPTYTLDRASKSDIVELVSETGKISTSGQTDVFSPTYGVVQTVLVDNGIVVEAGQELMTIKSTATEQEKDAALATYMAAKNTLDTAQATAYSLQATMFSQWDTFKKLAEGDTYEEANGTPKYNNRALPEFHIAEKDWLAAEANYKKQQAVISQAQAAVASTYLLYQATQDTTVKATAQGTIANLSVAPGQTVIAKLVTTSPVPLLTIASQTTTEVMVLLSETDAAKVHPTQEVKINVNAVNNREYKGLVKRVDTIGTEIAGVVRYHTYIEVLDADDKLRPGMTVDVDITTKKLTGVLAVPNAAVKPYQGGRAVRVFDAKKQIKYIPVEIGIKGTEKTEILSGIEEGQEVITSLSNEQIKRSGLFGS